MKYKKWIKIKGLSGHHYLEFHFYNSKEEEIVL